MATEGTATQVDETDAALEARLRRIYAIAGVLAVVWLALLAAGGIMVSNRILADRLAAAATVADAETHAIAGLIDRMFHELTAIPQVLAGNQDLRGLVSRYNAKEAGFASQAEEERRRHLAEDREVARLGSRLTRIRLNLRYDLIYVLDSRGIRIVSSEADKPAPLLGTRLDDRDYFKEAMAGRAGQMFAVARATEVPVFFFSAPVAEQDVPFGVVVVRQTAQAVASLLANRRSTSAIVDSRGMVVASSHPEFYMRHVSSVDRARLRQATKVDPDPDTGTLRDVYAQQNLRTIGMELPATGWDRRPAHGLERLVDGQPYLVGSDPLKAYPAYSLFVFTPIGWADNLRQLHVIIAALAAVLGMVLIFFGARTVAGLARRRHDAEITATLNEKLKKVNADKDRYLGIAAHDLRNPLSSMRGLSQMMMEMPLEPGQQKEFLETIHRTSDEMLGLVNDLLDVSVIESGKLTLRRSDHDVAKLIGQRIHHLEPNARNKKIDLRLQTSGAQKASIDSARFGQVIDNLVSNAIKFSPSGTTVQVALSSGDGHFAFSVQDQGPGISPEDQKLLFRSFQKLSARPTGGEKSTGLGLAIVKKIVDAHGGHIDVESAPGQGTRFTVTAPLVPAPGANP